MIVPAVTAPRLIPTCTLASTSRETDALEDIVGAPAFEGHPILVLNRFAAPEKSTGYVFCEAVRLNVSHLF